MAATLRNPEQVLLLSDHEVFVSENPDAVIGRDGVFGPEWYSIGIESKDAKVEITRNMDSEDIEGNGFGVIATKYKPGKVEGKVTVVEDNEMVHKIMFPDRVVDAAGVTLLRHTPKVLKLVYAVVHVRDDGSREILVSRTPAEAMCPTLGRGDTPEGREISFTFHPDKNKVIFEEYLVAPDGTISPLDLTSIRFVAPGTVAEDDPAAYKFNLNGATGGTWSLTAGSASVKGLAPAAKATDIQKALRAAGDSDITVEGDASTGFTIKKANGPVTVDTRALTGGDFPKRVDVTK